MKERDRGRQVSDTSLKTRTTCRDKNEKLLATGSASTKMLLEDLVLVRAVRKDSEDS